MRRSFHNSAFIPATAGKLHTSYFILYALYFNQMSRKIVLISPPWFFKERVEFLSQNLAVGYLAGWLEKHGHQVSIIDALVEGADRLVEVDTDQGVINRAGLEYEAISGRIPKDTGIIGITAPFTNHAIIVRELSAILKRDHPDATIVLGGIYPSTLPKKALTEGVDYVVKGEGEIPLERLAKGDDPRDTKGVWFRDNSGVVVDGGTADMVEDLDNIPHPARHLLPMEKYFRLSGRGRVGERAATVFTTRGCPFDCTFCSIHPVYGRKWRARSPENVLDEIRQLKENYSIEHIEFEDDNLTLDIRRAEAIFDGMLGMGLKWSCSNGLRVDKLDERLLVKMKDAGCAALHLAIEHGDPEMLKIMDKKLSLSKIKEVTDICFRLGIPTVGFFIFCHPGETRKRFNRGLKFAKYLKKRGMSGVGVHLAQAYPGTRLFKMCEENGWLVHKDTEDRLHFPGDIYIETPDFDAEEVERRLRVAKTALDFPGFEAEETCYEKLISSLASLLLGKGLLKVGPVRLGNRFIRGFYGLETSAEGQKFRWSKANASITVNHAGKRTRRLVVSLLSPDTKRLRILADGILVFDDKINEGENELSVDLDGIQPVKGKFEIEFSTSRTIPSSSGINPEDNRELGVIIKWLKLSG